MRKNEATWINNWDIMQAENENLDLFVKQINELGQQWLRNAKN